MRTPNDLITPARYEIMVEGLPDPNWAKWFDDMHIQALPGGRARLTGLIPDQPALHGVLERIRDLNLVLISVQRC